MATEAENLRILLESDGLQTVDAKKAIEKVVAEIMCCQERVRKHAESECVNFIPSHNIAEFYIGDAETLVREAKHILEQVAKEAKGDLHSASAELQQLAEDLREALLGIRVSQRILKIDDLFQCVENANTTKDYLTVLDVLNELKGLIYHSDDEAVDRVLEQCECYDGLIIKHHVQTNILKQNLQQRFESLVQLKEKEYPNAKCVTLRVSKDVQQLQDSILALFQCQYNISEVCIFLYGKCFEPIIMKPVSMEYSDDNMEYVQVKLSYTLKDVKISLRPSYKQVFEHMRLLLRCLEGVNVSVSADEHVFSMIGDQLKEQLLNLLVKECLMNAIPETMDDLQESTLVQDVLEFESALDEVFLIDSSVDKALREFAENFDTLFRNRFLRKVVDTAQEIMMKDLQDMTQVAEQNTPANVATNPCLFPCCMVSKSTMELIRLMESIQRQPIKGDESNCDIIATVLNNYVTEVPKMHERLLESIPQQSALFYNNCEFLVHWSITNSELAISSSSVVLEALQASGLKCLKSQVHYQQKLITDILRELELNDVHTLGNAPFKLMRQCLRQLELLKNVWQNVLPNDMYKKIFTELLHQLCSEIIKHIADLQDISTTVANELSEMIKIVLDKAPSLFKEPHEVLQVKSWMKIEQLRTILNASLVDITEMWCGGAGILTVNYTADEVKHLIRALFQNTDRRAIALAKII